MRAPAAPRRLVLASNNRGKLAELQAVASKLGITGTLFEKLE